MADRKLSRNLPDENLHAISSGDTTGAEITHGARQKYFFLCHFMESCGTDSQLDH